MAMETPQKVSADNVDGDYYINGDADVIETPDFASPSISVESDCTSAGLGVASLTGMEQKQLAQLFEKGIDDAGCAAILNMSTDLVGEFRSQAPEGAAPSPDKNLDQREERQLREMFVRHVTPASCADILHVDLDSVKEFLRKEEAKKEEAKKSALSRATAATHRITNDPAFRVSAACAAAGTVGGAVTGGGAGTVVGGIVGAAAGLGPALLTFGMSIPISTGIGSGIGLCIGTVSGAAAGAVAGGAAGYAGFTYRKELQEGRAKVVSKAHRVVEMLGVGRKLKLCQKSEAVAIAG